jgi:putative transposase
VTEFNVKGTKLYLSPVLDLYNSEIIAWNMTTHLRMNLVENMLSKAVKRLKPGDRPVLLSDQGWQYQMARYQEKQS